MPRNPQGKWEINSVYKKLDFTQTDKDNHDPGFSVDSKPWCFDSRKFEACFGSLVGGNRALSGTELSHSAAGLTVKPSSIWTWLDSPVVYQTNHFTGQESRLLSQRPENATIFQRFLVEIQRAIALKWWPQVVGKEENRSSQWVSRWLGLCTAFPGMTSGCCGLLITFLAR